MNNDTISKDQSVKLIIAIISLLILSGCGLKLITESDLDHYCFGCQSAGYAHCASGAREVNHVSLTREETEQILLILKNSTEKNTIKRNTDKSDSVKSDNDNKENATNKILTNLDGYKRLK